MYALLSSKTNQGKVLQYYCNPLSSLDFLELESQVCSLL